MFNQDSNNLLCAFDLENLQKQVPLPKMRDTLQDDQINIQVIQIFILNIRSNLGRNLQLQSQNPFNQQHYQSQPGENVDRINNQSLLGHQQSSNTRIRIIERIQKQDTNQDQNLNITKITLCDISIKIWNLYLSALYENEFITTRENPPYISFNKDKHSSQILYESIDSIFKSQTYTKLAYGILDNELLILLRKLQKNNRLFHKDINTIKSELQVPYIS